MNERVLTIKLPLSHNSGIRMEGLPRGLVEREKAKNSGVLNKENGII
jgi:hypothetical protein